jgi:hypothetical protein
MSFFSFSGMRGELFEMGAVTAQSEYRGAATPARIRVRSTYRCCNSTNLGISAPSASLSLGAIRRDAVHHQRPLCRRSGARHELNLQTNSAALASAPPPRDCRPHEIVVIA